MRTLVTALLLAALALPASAAAAPTATQTACNVVRINGSAYVFFKSGVKCTFAKTWARRLTRSGGSNKPKGFKCSSGTGFKTGGQCYRKGDTSVIFGWHPGD